MRSKDDPVSSETPNLAQMRFDNLFKIRGAAKVANEWTANSHISCTFQFLSLKCLFHVRVCLQLLCRWSWAGGKCLCMWVCASVRSEVWDQLLRLMLRVGYPSGKSLQIEFGMQWEKSSLIYKNRKSEADILCSWPNRYVKWKCIECHIWMDRTVLCSCMDTVCIPFFFSL